MRLPFVFFSSHSAKIMLRDGRNTTLRVGDIVNLKDDQQYRVLKFFAPSGPIVFKRTDDSTHGSFLRTPAHVVISAPQMVNRSTQTDPLSSSKDDPLAQAILHFCGPDVVAAYHHGRPHCLGGVHWLTVPETIKGAFL